MMHSESFSVLSKLVDKIGRPLCVFDLETTGLGNRAGIVQIAMVSVHGDKCIEQLNLLLNPGEPINPFATKVHGITDAQVRDAPSFTRVAGRISTLIDSHIMCGFNSSACDLPILQNQFDAHIDQSKHPEWGRLQQMDVRHAWRRFTGGQKGRLGDLAAYYGVKPGAAHDAMGDVLTTMRVLEAMVLKHGMEWVLRASGLMDDPELEQNKSSYRRKASNSFTPSEPGSPSKRSQMIAMICDCITKHGFLAPADASHIIATADITPNTLSFGVVDLINEGMIALSTVRDENSVAALEAPVLQFLRGHEKPLLKPIKEWIKNHHGLDADYLQLRIAIIDTIIKGLIPKQHPATAAYLTTEMKFMLESERNGVCVNPKLIEATTVVRRKLAEQGIRSEDAERAAVNQDSNQRKNSGLPSQK